MRKKEEYFIDYAKEKIIQFNQQGNLEEVRSYIQCVYNEKEEPVTKPYFGMEILWGDYLTFDEMKIVQYGTYDCKLKTGVMKLKRNANGKIIPFAEETVVKPYYNRVKPGGSNTIIAEANDKCTYVDLDQKSQNYGKQLVPVQLKTANPFNQDFQGFAKCTIEGTRKELYLPRYLKPTTDINIDDFFTPKEVNQLMSFRFGDSEGFEKAFAKIKRITNFNK